MLFSIQETARELLNGGFLITSGTIINRELKPHSTQYRGVVRINKRKSGPYTGV